MMVIDNKYDFGDVVYILTDPEQEPGIVTRIEIAPSGHVSYQVSKGAFSALFYDFEISATKDILKHY